MAENKDKDKKPAARHEHDAAHEARMRESTERQERIDRSAREVASADAPETRSTLVGGIPVTVPNESPEGIVAEAAAGMLEQQARMMSGQAVTPTLTPEQEQRQHEAALRRAADHVPGIQGDPLMALGRALAEQQVGEPLTVDDLYAPEPGQTERGWDPEVTARHPKFLAAMVEELEGGVSGKKSSPLGASGELSKEHFIDPTDTVALATAQRDLAFHESRKAGIIQRAIRVGSDRLAAAQEAGGAGYSQAMAVRDVLEDICRDGRAAGHDL